MRLDEGTPLAARGVAVLEVSAVRCERRGVPDATVSEVLRSRLACRAT